MAGSIASDPRLRDRAPVAQHCDLRCGRGGDQRVLYRFLRGGVPLRVRIPLAWRGRPLQYSQHGGTPVPVVCSRHDGVCHPVGVDRGGTSCRELLAAADAGLRAAGVGGRSVSSGGRDPRRRVRNRHRILEIARQSHSCSVQAPCSRHPHRPASARRNAAISSPLRTSRTSPTSTGWFQVLPSSAGKRASSLN